MIRDIMQTTNIVVTVKLKSGKVFKNKDITSCPQGERETVISFWEEGAIRAYPLSEVEYYEFSEGI